jgi:pyruvate,water dikinase
MERGLLEDDRDFYFLGEEELYDLFRGAGHLPMVKAKIAGRRANFEAVADKSVNRPEYLQHAQLLEIGAEERDDSSGVLHGVGTAPGTVTGRAHIVKHLKDIGDLRSGEILICNSTDPGWTPVFLVIAGVVIETGGLLAHASCLAREYGFPAVQLPSAMDRIPDGATITVDGAKGTVTILSEEKE